MEIEFDKVTYGDIWRRYQANESLTSIAKSYNVSVETIRQKIERYKRYLRRIHPLDIRSET